MGVCVGIFYTIESNLLLKARWAVKTATPKVNILLQGLTDLPLTKVRESRTFLRDSLSVTRQTNDLSHHEALRLSFLKEAACCRTFR